MDEVSESVPKVRVPRWRWLAAILLAPVILVLVQLPMMFLFSQLFEDVPGRWRFVPFVGEFAIALAVTLLALRDFLFR